MSQPTDRPDRPEWTAANNIGLAGEQAVAAVLMKIGMAVEKMADRRADLAITGAIEVKTDRQAIRTGNVAVEVAYKGRPSGINTTCASGWAFVLGGSEIVLIRTERLRTAIANLPEYAAGEGAIVKLLTVSKLRQLGVSIGGPR